LEVIRLSSYEGQVLACNIGGIEDIWRHMEGNAEGHTWGEVNHTALVQQQLGSF
jgi:hypothetical protein